MYPAVDSRHDTIILRQSATFSGNVEGFFFPGRMVIWLRKILVAVSTASLLAVISLTGCAAIMERDRMRAAADIERSRAIQLQSQSDAIAAVADAMRPNYWPLVFVVLVGGVVAGTWVYWRGRVAYVQAVSQAQLPQIPQEFPPLAPTWVSPLPAIREVPQPVLREARRRGGMAEYDEDAQRWLIVDASGKVLARQVKTLEAKR